MPIIVRRHDEGTITLVAHCHDDEGLPLSEQIGLNTFRDCILQTLFLDVMLAVKDYGVAHWMSHHPSIDEIFVFSKDRLYIKLDRRFVDDFNKNQNPPPRRTPMKLTWERVGSDKLDVSNTSLQELQRARHLLVGLGYVSEESFMRQLSGAVTDRMVPEHLPQLAFGIPTRVLDCINEAIQQKQPGD